MRLAALLCAFLLALPAYAEDMPAGFAPGQIWLSKNAPTAGESVEIYTVIYDASGTPLEGSVRFQVDDEIVGSVPFTLGAGETKIQSVRWRATAGTHSLSAIFDTAIHRETKQDTGIKGKATASTTITVTEPEPIEEESGRERAVGISTPDIVAAASSYPIVANMITATETIRTGGEALLAQYASTSQSLKQTENGGEVLGASTYSPEPSPLVTKAAEAALPFFAYPALFYPLVLILLLFLLWLVSRKLRHPGRRRRT